MFDFFKSKKSNPNETVLGNLTVNQKMSVTNLLYLIARSDGGFNKKELAYLNTCYLGCSLEKCASYLNSNGHSEMFCDLNQLTSSQKDYILITAFELIYCDGKANETELNSLIGAFEKLGYTEDSIADVMEKSILLRKKFL